VVALLNDLFGIQCRGGCSCAGPYGHRLLGIDLDHANAFASQAAAGWLGIKPGWTRLSFSFYLSEPVFDYIVEAVHLVATHGARLLGDYRFDPRSGLWRHHRAPLPPPGLSRIVDDREGGLGRPEAAAGRAPERALDGYLRQARQILAARPDPAPPTASGSRSCPTHWSGCAGSNCQPSASTAPQPQDDERNRRGMIDIRVTCGTGDGPTVIPAGASSAEPATGRGLSQATSQALTGSLPSKTLRRAVLLSDGASRLVDPFGLATWEELLALLDENGPKELLRQVRAAEAEAEASNMPGRTP
jgi:hypothetical protein